MITKKDLRTLVGATAHDRSGEKVGKIGQIYYDDDTDQPRWVSVQMGLLGTSESVVPLEGARVDSGIITLAYDKQKIKNAPDVSADRHLSLDEEADLHRYYGNGAHGGRAADAQVGGGV